jgi:hypothetical protein
VSGFTTLPPWTSWSYCRMIHSFEQTLPLARIFFGVAVLSSSRQRQRPQHRGERRRPLEQRDPGVEKLHVELAHDLAAVPERELPVAREAADHGRLHVLRAEHREALVELRGRHRDHHPLLRLADPDFGVRETVVLSGTFSRSTSAPAPAHFAHAQPGRRRGHEPV